MIVVLNAEAGGGKAERRWHSIRHRLPLPPWTRVVPMGDRESLCALVRDEAAAGERDFVAAGGDGTVHALLNALLTVLPGEKARECRLGAIGLGSSNDFHKPWRPWQSVEGIPFRLDFARSTFRDVGVATLDPEGPARTRWFLLNASLGLTAEANAWFNSGNRTMSLLKRHSSSLAIAWATLRTILLAKNIDADVRTGVRISSHLRLTNLAVVKSPHVSGSLSFGGFPVYDTGTFRVYLSCQLGILGRLRLLMYLLHGSFPGGARHTSWDTKDLIVWSDAPFRVETDGEVARARSVKFSVFPQYLQVCP